MRTGEHRPDSRFLGEGTPPKVGQAVWPAPSGTQENILRTVTNQWSAIQRFPALPGTSGFAMGALRLMAFSFARANKKGITSPKKFFWRERNES